MNADYEHFKFEHAQKPYLEFPIMDDGSAFDGSESPGADRVVGFPLSILIDLLEWLELRYSTSFTS